MVRVPLICAFPELVERVPLALKSFFLVEDFIFEAASFIFITGYVFSKKGTPRQLTSRRRLEIGISTLPSTIPEKGSILRKKKHTWLLALGN
jgi:hypothetical protein